MVSLMPWVMVMVVHGSSRAGGQGVLAGLTATNVRTLSGLLARYGTARVDVNLSISTAL